MSSVCDYYKCPQCGGLAYNEYYLRTRAESEFCFRCGRWTKMKLPSTAEEKALLLPGEARITQSGFGYGRCSIAGKNGVGRSFSLSEPYSEEIEKWYQEAMSDETVDPETSYLTRWDEETKQVIVVHGKDPGLYEDAFCEEEPEYLPEEEEETAHGNSEQNEL